MRLRTLVLAAITLAACSSKSGSSHRADDGSVTDGRVSVTFHGDTRSLVLSRGQDTLLTFPADGLALGAVDAVDDGADYDPFPNGTPPASPDGLRWLTLQDAHLLTSDAASYAMDLVYDEGKHANLVVKEDAPGSFAVTLTPAADGPPIALFRLRPRVDPQEGFYGLGEYYDDVNQRGHVRAMQLEADGGATESGYNEAHIPIPLLVGTRGWGLFVASRYPGIFDVATQSPDLVEVTFGTGAASSAGLAFHLFGVDHPLDVTKLYYDVTGYPKLPARWALGPWLWRDDSHDQAQVESDVQTMRDLDLAHTAIWLDRPYATDVETFDFDPKKFTDPPAMIGKVHDLGFRIALWHTPYIDEKAATTAALLKEANDKGYFPPVSSLPLNKWGRPLDLTNTAAYGWWQSLLHKYTDVGIEGFKLDYAEDIAPTVGTGRNVWKFSDGSDERTMHAGYALLYHKLYSEMVPKDGGFLLCRAGTWGDQVNVSVAWPGDLDATFAKRGDPANGYVSVGGLPASIIAGLTLGPSGFPFYGADTGGYRHSPADKELFTRWFEQTALSTVMQIGNASSTVAWEKDPQTGFDDEMLGWYRTYTRLHLRLFPYEWTYAQGLATTGRAITRALGLAYPELGQHPSDEYMFGDDLLVAPVVARGATGRSVIFPAGEWIDWWTGDVHPGGATANVSAPLGTLPLFVRRGAIVPLLRPTIDAMAPTTLPDKVDSYATTPGMLYPRIVAGADGTFTVFDGTLLETKSSPQNQWVHAKGGSEFSSGMVVEILAFTGTPTAATIDNNPTTPVATAADLDGVLSGVAFSGSTAFVKIPGGDHVITVTTP